VDNKDKTVGDTSHPTLAERGEKTMDLWCDIYEILKKYKRGYYFLNNEKNIEKILRKKGKILFNTGTLKSKKRWQTE